MPNNSRQEHMPMLKGVGRSTWSRGLWLALLLLSISATSWAQFLSFTEYPVPTANSVPGCIAQGPDGALWFTEPGVFANNIGRVTTAGAITEYPIPTFNSGAYCIRPGPDGALWFTESRGNKIGRITTAGAITEYAIPTTDSAPLGIISGPDGALWFTERKGNKIGQITTSGTITEYTIPTVASYPAGIAAGPDGALWFTESSGDEIGRITTAGVITEYAIPTKGSGPWGIWAGPDGALWFTEQSGNKIGQITTAGVITEYAIPTTDSAPWGIRAGPDGALWFTERKGNKIGRITTAGAITEYAIPVVPGNPVGISLGPDGALWITDDGPNSIIRAAIVAQAPPLTIFTSPPLTSAPLPDGSVGVSYAQTLSATGGAPPYTWAVSAGSLPAGLKLNPTTGQIRGTPTAIGPAIFTVEVRDTSQATATEVFSLTIDPNNISQFPLPLTYSFGGITAGPDGALWFTESTSTTDQVGRITTSGAITQYQIPACDCPVPGAITTGPDGALWFAEGPSIGRITTAGAVTPYFVPNGIDTDGITAGPDGALWFTDASADYIGRITTAGAITQYPVTPHSDSPDGIDAITTGPDGALWFTETVGYIGRITTAGVITEFPVQAVPTAITAGPDGALWFTDSNGAIGRITTAGAVTEYPTPTSGSDPAGITLGPDGALWFTEADANNIGRITTTGAITEYPIPSADAGFPGAITSGPDGALWFTQNGSAESSSGRPPAPTAPAAGGAIGRLLPAPTLTAINPTSGAQGTTVPVVLTGSSFVPLDVPSGTKVNVPAGITLTNLNVISPTQVAVAFTIASSVATGPVNVTVTTSGGTSQPVTFTITPPSPPPSLTSINPASGVQGTSVPVVLTGANFITGPTIIATNFFDDYNQLVPFTQTPTLVDNGQLTMTSTVYPDPTDPNSQWVDFNFQSVKGGPLASNPYGFWQIYLTNIPLTVPGTFTGLQYYWTIKGTAAPNITPISFLSPVVPNLINPALGLVYGSTFQGGTPLSLLDVFVALDDYTTALQTGSMNPSEISGFHLAARTTGGAFGPATVLVGNPGVTVSNLNLVSATQITATLNVAANAPLGPANVTVSNPIGTSAPPPAVTFTVLPPPPTLISTSPSAGTVGKTISVQLNGSNFVPGGTTVSVTGGVTAGSVSVTSSSQLSASFNIPAAATPGSVNVTVTTAGGTSGPVGFTIDSAPLITTASPLPTGTVGSAYSQGVSVSGGTSPYLWQVTTGSLPANLALDPATCTGDPPAHFRNVNNAARATNLSSPLRPRQTSATTCLIVGTPTAYGTSYFTLQVTDASGAAASAPFALTINPLPPTIISINPSTGVQGTSVPVTIAGTNFVPGATVSVSNTGVTVSNVVVASASQITASFTIASGATLGPDNVLVTTSGGTTQQPAVFTVLRPPPVLTSVIPSAGTVGTAISVILNGSNFVSGGTTVSVTGGVTASKVVVAGGSQLSVTFNIPATATPGQVNVTVTTAGGTAGPVGFTIDPAPRITPASFLPAGTVGSAYSQGVSVNGGTPPYTWLLTAGSLPAGLSLDPATCTGAPLALFRNVNNAAGSSNSSSPFRSRQTSATTCLIVGTPTTYGTSNFTLQVTDASGATASGSFALIIHPAPPTITSINPPGGAQGTSVLVTITGTNFVTGATVLMGNPGVTVSNVQVVSALQITATFTIASGAALGPETVLVATSGGATQPAVFTVLPSPPVLTAIAPSTGAQGTSAQVTLTGTNFVAGATIAVGTNGVTASNVTVVSPTQITATFTIASNAAVGPANVTVTTSSGASGPVTFTVLAPLKLISISPAAGVQGASVPVTLTGSGFVAGAQIAVGNPGVTVGSVDVVSATQITATFKIAADAALGAANVTVSMPGGSSGQVTFGPVTFTVLAPLKLTSISPAAGAQGASVPVTLTGAGFAAGAQIAIGNSGVTAGSIDVVSSAQITATFNIGATAAVGPANVTVTVAGVTSAPVTFTVNASPPTLTSISAANAPQGASVAVTLTGTNFVSGATITVANPGVTAGSIVVVSATQITAALTIAADAAVGATTVTVNTPGGASGSVSFTVDPPVTFSITGLPSSISSGQQISFTVSIAQAYPENLTGELTLQFTPGQSLPSDPMIALLGGTCVAGTCSVDFQIPASQTSASFSLQTGTVAGALAFSITNVTVGGTAVTLSNNPPTSVSVPLQPPGITSVSIQPESSGFNIVVTGFSNTRAITEADFTFTPASGDQLQTSTFSLTNVAGTFQSYYTTDASLAVGSEFVYTQAFSLTAGSIGTLQSVTVILKNAQGASSAVTANF